MNTMNIPGFTAEASFYKTSGYYQSKEARGFGRGKNDNQVYLQRPNKDNIKGGRCNSTMIGETGYPSTVYRGYYDDRGWCCGPTLCQNCNVATCGDGHTTPKEGTLEGFTFGIFQGGPDLA